MRIQNLIDVHCHFFNVWYALREAVAIGWNKIRGKYPYADSTRVPTPIEMRELREDGDWNELLNYVARLALVALQSCQSNHKYEIDMFAKSKLGTGTNEPLITVPLMMDIYFCLHDNSDEAHGTEQREQRKIWTSPASENLESEFENFLEALGGDVLGVTKKVADLRGIALDPSFSGRLDDEIRLIRIECLEWEDSKLPRHIADLSPGYRKHLHDLESLRDAHPESVFPFLAVDPRRRGVLDLIKAKVDSSKGPFRGVKLYPPLGYLPSHPELLQIYAHCLDRDIPITSHCSPGGIGTFVKRIYVRGVNGGRDVGWICLKECGQSPNVFFANPEQWLPVLDMDGLRLLRLNLAHFGHDPYAVGWGDTIARRILEVPLNPTSPPGSRYPNIFCDMSYFTDSALPSVVQTLIDRFPVLRERLMFGTDFVMIMLDTQLGGLRNYFDMYANLPTGVLRDNAKAFLRLVS